MTNTSPDGVAGPSSFSTEDPRGIIRAVESDLLTVPEAASFLRCSKSYLDKLRCTGGGPEFVRLGVRKILYRRIDLQNWAKARRFDSTSEYKK